MDRIDWEYDKGRYIFAFLVLMGLAAIAVIAGGYLLHVGWDLYHS
jgi:hypothetical protein